MLLLPVLFFVLKRKQVELFRGGVTKDYIAFYFTYNYDVCFGLISQSRDHAEVEVNESGLKFLKKLRQDLEKVRLLLELIRKREKLKCECVGHCALCFSKC